MTVAPPKARPRLTNARGSVVRHPTGPGVANDPLSTSPPQKPCPQSYRLPGLLRLTSGATPDLISHSLANSAVPASWPSFPPALGALQSRILHQDPRIKESEAPILVTTAREAHWRPGCATKRRNNMSFFGKFKTGSTPGASSTSPPTKKDPNAPQPTALEKLLAPDALDPVRPNGSDKFFGFENYGSTCYCNSIVTALYYSEAFREHVINFPSAAFLESISDEIAKGNANGAPTGNKNTSTTPCPNPLSPARKVVQPTSPGPATAIKPEESKDSPEYKKRMAIQSGPVLDMTYDNSKRYGMDESLFTSLKDIFEAVIEQKSRIGVVSPHKFLEILRRENEMFRSAMHQDAHEFLNLLLNQVVDNVELFSSQHPAPLPQPHANGGAPETALSKPMTNGINGTNVPANGLDTRWVHDLFEGTLTSETRCLTCENTSQRDEAFLDLSVDLSAHTSVTSCLRKFSEEEMLCERNKFHCDNCGGLQEAEKRMKIKRLPRILALHLKRFKYTEDLQRLQKLFHRVVYPFYLRLFNTTDDAEDPDRLYELYAVVVHIGGGPYHGHYVSIIKTQDRGWLLFDDELVEPVDKNYVMNFFGGEPQPGVQDAKQLACAYVLFYQETTMEAMLREQEAEGQQQTKPRTSDAGTAPDSALSPTHMNNPLYHTQTVTDPPHEILDHMKPLAHAATAPQPGHMRQPDGHIPPLPNINPVMPPKSKKEIKAEEKERKAAQKAEEKALAAQRKESASKRMEAWRKQEAEMAQIVEMSKASAAEEAKKRGEEPAAAKEEKSGLSRFARHGSMSLRGKPKLFGGKEKEKDSGLPPVPQGSKTDAPAAPEAPITAAEEKAKKNRFSLGRKKSTTMM
ncbi:hypothetical protein Q7P37_011373 [Cladosporium fusiforme]